ncbi:class II glutamine amidotransferase [Frankia sp. CNm7]|uniref:Class II glutamine amidotransferase n=1 Tax=Frankia nepalensis TaxID=1836974 RepID=A0A937UP36_9ACTN|nr:class II glutamine amidotransferase [Frankia nepalensis]MBL7497160.1 class II glutamine amidotransferase [Frankia nepalensis]MBL7513102.1 class II glutamine amidotransferase [Frankia nepalensis]MBL7524427.1 class II glutamine amidotransferase [Frankia nepalensis]MBL7626865.1 class II glutamine amidotransferase [Frankia nepalensis]
MCRLFGMSSSPRRAHATFWLLDAPDSLSDQSRREPDGTGLGFFDADGAPILHKAPIAAYEDRSFAQEAKQVESTTFLAHIRFASTGGLEQRNTHPFEQDGRLFAHNGVLEGLDELERQLGPDVSMVHGDTDSERFFALITREIRSGAGDVAGGIEGAARWIARHLPVYALNLIIATPGELWALRYPDTNPLYVLERPAGGHHGDRHLDHSGTAGHLRVHSRDLVATPAVVVASEPMDDNPAWRPMEPGELLHAGPDLRITRGIVLTEEPAHRLALKDLRPVAAASQKPR